MDKPEDRLDTYKLHNIMTLYDFQNLFDDTKDMVRSNFPDNLFSKLLDGSFLNA